MDARFYNSDDIDLERLSNDLVNAYLAQGYQAQQIGNKDQMLVQLKKGGDFEALIGMQAALSVTIQRTAGGVLALIGQQKWIDKAAVGAVGIVALPVLWPLAITAGVGALRQASLGNQVLNMVDGLVRQQRPGVVAGPIPYQIMPQIQQQIAPPSYVPNPSVPQYVPPRPIVQEIPVAPPLPAPAPPQGPAQLHCPNCNTLYEEGDTFCSGCGRSLIPAKQYCSNCNSEVKPGAAFCPKCGASTFHTVPASQPAPPSVVPTPKPTYTSPPVVQTPAYTPPAAPPAYTPPARPEKPVYTPPPTPPPAGPASAPTIAAQAQPMAPELPTEPYYTPPTPKDPSVQPQPKVSYTPNTPKRGGASTPPPPRPQKVYYTPSTQGQAQPAAQPAQNADVQWGTLTFNNGTQISLKGERAVVGRYDHDLGGIEPEIDLAKMDGADTVSRVHAALEHIGGGYTLTDLNSTNSTRINGKRLEPDKAMSINEGDTLSFGKVTATFKRA
jgi:FHA domain/Double zinc ribbon